MALRKEKAGLFISEWRNFGLASHAKWAWDAGFRWIVLKGHSGAGPPDTGHPSSDYVQILRNMGFNVGCWGAFGPDDPPVGCAQAANGIIGALGYSFYVANLEVPFNDLAFLREFRKWQPGRDLWLSSEISNPRNWWAWYNNPEYRAATCWQPQCYTARSGKEGETPKQAHYWAVRQDIPVPRNIPAAFVKPTVEETQDARKPVSSYVAELKDTALGPGGEKLGPGFSVYLGETSLQAEYVQWGKAISEGLALL